MRAEENCDNLVGRGNDFNVFEDSEDKLFVVKKPRIERLHPTRHQAKVDVDIVNTYFSRTLIGNISFIQTGEGIQDFELKQLKTQKRKRLTWSLLREVKSEIHDILTLNDKMIREAGVSLDFTWFRCLYPQTWFPENWTIMSDNLAFDDTRGLVIEDTGLLHMEPIQNSWVPDKHILSFRCHRWIEKQLLCRLLLKT